MKKFLACVLSASMMLGLLAGCGSGNNDPVNTPAAGGSETPSQESTAALSGRPTHRAAESIRARVLFFMTFILQSCIVLVAFGNGYQYTDGL